MKKLASILLFITSTTIYSVRAQVIMPEKEVTQIFTATVKSQFNIQYPIFRVYKYIDKAGQFYTVLTESRDSIGSNKDTISFNVKAVTLKSENGKLSKAWELSDAVDKAKKGEQAIWFWSKYIDFKDLDKDAMTEAIIVYGTEGTNHFEDGRIGIAIFYKGQKTMVRQQNGTLDFERKLQVEKQFYSLPKPIQHAVIEKMKVLAKKWQAIFPVGWEQAMAKKQTVISGKN
jgi:hypothetical protein